MKNKEPSCVYMRDFFLINPIADNRGQNLKPAISK